MVRHPRAVVQPGQRFDVDECKACGDCGAVKPLTEFARKSTGRGGRAARCKVCLAAWALSYRQTNREHVRATERQWYTDNSERKRASKAAYRARNRERIEERRRATYRERYAADPSPWRAAKSRRMSRSTQCLDELDRALSRAYRAVIRNDRCRYCGEHVPGDMHDDHFYPLSKGGTDHWWNLVRACGPCNRHKHARCGTWFLLRRGPKSGTARPVPTVP